MTSEPPKIFISYSWQPDTHKEKVIQLAEKLTLDGIVVIIDEWDLHPGMDNHSFMEKMVNDDSVKNVLIICNREYKQKANKKAGGVGKESLIISGELYSQVSQTKFIPIIYEFDESGKPEAPTFVSTRFYIDLSNEDTFVGNYNRLVRTIYGRPESQRPPLGKPPAFILEDEKVFLPTSHKIPLIKNALISEKRNAILLVEEYLDLYVEALTLFRLDEKFLNKETFQDVVFQRITEMLPLRDDFINFLSTYLKYSLEIHVDSLHRFFEKITEVLVKDKSYYQGSDYNLENLALDIYRFFYYELFLYFTLIMIEKERFKELTYILTSPFIVHIYNQDVFDFTDFKSQVASLNEFYKQRNNLKRVSVVADKLKERVPANLQFEDLISVDILLHYLAAMHFPSKRWGWFPETSAYRRGAPQLPIMRKAISERYFNKVKVLFGIETKDELLSNIENAQKKLSEHNIGFYYEIPQMKIGLNYDNLCSYK